MSRHEVLLNVRKALEFAEDVKAEGSVKIEIGPESRPQLLASLRDVMAVGLLSPEELAERYYRLVILCADGSALRLVPWEKLPEQHRAVFVSAAAGLLLGEEP